MVAQPVVVRVAAEHWFHNFLYKIIHEHSRCGEPLWLCYPFDGFKIVEFPVGSSFTVGGDTDLT